MPILPAQMDYTHCRTLATVQLPHAVGARALKPPVFAPICRA